MSGVRKKSNHTSVFKPQTKGDDEAVLTETIILSARRTGQLSLSSKGLSTVPSRVWRINELTETELKEIHYELDYDHKEERWWEQEPLKFVDLSCNSLTAIDSKIEYLAELTVLDLHNNLLESLPPEIGSLCKLRKLDISENKLMKLPKKFYKLIELRELNMRNNALKTLDPGIGDLIMLTHLDLSFNQLIKLPTGMGYLVRLVSLDLSHNMIKELPPDITNMRALQKLNASFNELEIVPPFGELRKLETLMLQMNKLRTFPDVSSCTVLKTLYLADNEISEIDISHLEGVGHLKVLTLGNNKIEEIPEDVIRLINLEIFDLSNNHIAIIPSCIGILPNLKQFVIDGNEIQNVRKDIIRCGTNRILQHIRQSTDIPSVNKRELFIPSIGPNIYPDKYAMKNTGLLSLAGQNLTDIPEDVLENASLASVTSVDLSRNKLQSLPNKLSVITMVTDLKLTSNLLTYLPDWIGEKFVHLQHLDLSRNNLQSLPTSINLLRYLREINISFNRYTEIPVSLYGVASLEILIATDNAITDIDIKSLKQLERLATLDLTNNNISHVPPELGNMTHLRTLLLSGNCFKHPRQAVLMKSTEEILMYLRNRIPE